MSSIASTWITVHWHIRPRALTTSVSGRVHPPTRPALATFVLLALWRVRRSYSSGVFCAHPPRPQTPTTSVLLACVCPRCARPFSSSSDVSGVCPSAGGHSSGVSSACSSSSDVSSCALGPILFGHARYFSGPYSSVPSDLEFARISLGAYVLGRVRPQT